MGKIFIYWISELLKTLKVLKWLLVKGISKKYNSWIGRRFDINIKTDFNL